MIENSFCILSGIGERLERRIWGEGVLTWDHFIERDKVLSFGTERKRLFNEVIDLHKRQLASRNASHFSGAIRRREHWRLFDCFRDGAVCLDIETSGLQPESGGYVTVIGLYDGFDYRALVCGEDLTAERLRRELQGYKLLITFFGSAFDVPFIQHSLGSVGFDMPHFDLCFGARRLGFRGGLKRLEREFGIERDVSVQGLDGYDAVKLWQSAKEGSRESLELLITYNREDTVNLYRLAEIIYQKLKQSTGIEEYISCGVV